MEAEHEQSGDPSRRVDLHRIISFLDAADLRRITHFVAVAQELHFHRAAQLLYMSQPALSQSVRKLEESLGFKLLERSSRRVELTPAGHVLFAEASERLEQFCTMVERARAATRDAVPALSLGYAGACSSSVGEIVGRFTELFASMDLDCRQDHSGRLRLDVMNRVLDVAVVMRQEESTPLASETLRRFHVHCAMDRRHPLRDREVIEYAAFDRYPLVLVKSAGGSPWHSYFRALLAEHGVEPEVLLLSDPFFAIPQAMRTAGGLWPMTEEYPLSDGVRRPMESGAYIDYDVIWRADNDSPMLKRFLRLARRVRREERWAVAS